MQYVNLVISILMMELVKNVMLARKGALPALLVRRVQRVLLLLIQTELIGYPQLQIVRIYFKYN